MSGRVTGYHYEVGADGRKHRVYDQNTRGPVSASIPRGPRPRPASRRPFSAARSARNGALASNVLRGSGSYYNSSFVKAMRKALPSGSFEKAGTMVGGPIGGWAGSMLGKIAGFGDYQVTTNSLIGEGQSPAVMHSGKDVTVVRHREYIQDIVSSNTPNAFTNQPFPIQPGLQGTFPWLAPIAQQFEQYTIRGMVFEYKTLFADAIASSQANSTVGGVILATDYNVLNSPFSTKQQMDNTQYTTSCKPSVSFYHPIECKPGSAPTNQLFVRSGTATGDQRLYDLGLLQVASFGVAAAAVVLGELWCTYEIEFSKPINNGATASVLSDHFHLGSVTNALPLGTTSVPAVNSSLGGTITQIVGSSTYVFPPEIQEGTYLFSLWWVGSSTANLQVPTVTANGCALLPLWNNDSSVAAITSPTTTSGSMFMSFVVHVDAPGSPGVPPSLLFGGAGTLPASVTGADLFVTEFDSDIVD